MYCIILSATKLDELDEQSIDLQITKREVREKCQSAFSSRPIVDIYWRVSCQFLPMFTSTYRAFYTKWPTHPGIFPSNSFPLTLLTCLVLPFPFHAQENQA